MHPHGTLTGAHDASVDHMKEMKGRCSWDREAENGAADEVEADANDDDDASEMSAA